MYTANCYVDYDNPAGSPAPIRDRHDPHLLKRPISRRYLRTGPLDHGWLSSSSSSYRGPGDGVEARPLLRLRFAIGPRHTSGGTKLTQETHEISYADSVLLGFFLFKVVLILMRIV